MMCNACKTLADSRYPHYKIDCEYEGCTCQHRPPGTHGVSVPVRDTAESADTSSQPIVVGYSHTDEPGTGRYRSATPKVTVGELASAVRRYLTTRGNPRTGIK